MGEWRESFWHKKETQGLNESVVLSSVFVTIVAYFCHFLTNNYVDTSDRYDNFSENYVDLSENYVDLSEFMLTGR